MFELLFVALAAGAPADDFYHPYYRAPKGPATIDMRTLKVIEREPEPAPLRIDQLDSIRVDPSLQVLPTSRHDGVSMPDGWVQRGDAAFPADVANGLRQVDPIPPAAFEDIPGNKYPRKHTLYLNFVGGNLVSTISGNDISAEDISVLAIDGPYPAFSGGEPMAVAIAQAVQADLADYGVRVIYLERPPKMLPYTMEMVGGDWTDTTLDSAAGGVAPTADCSALNQRHIVYTFAEGVGSTTILATTASQEAGHAWGLDHTLNCESVMSYCGGFMDLSFSTTCDALCEEQCQGANSIGCRLNHEIHCGEGSNAQNEGLELEYLFGGNEPDMVPPTCDILSPADGDDLEVGSDAYLSVDVDDDYGGMGWQIMITKDGETVYDEIDYFKDNIDDDFNAALNLTALEAGTYTVTASCTDHADHLVENTITFTVGGGTPGTAEGSDTGVEPSTSGTAGGTGMLDDTGDEDDDGGSSVGEVPRGDEEKGCACSSRGGSAGAWWAIVLVCFVARRRRSG
jgi:MYXO-CTERM domain-containing protein